MKHRAAKPRRGDIGVASHSYGWYVDAAGKACCRYAICITYYRVPTARPLPLPSIQPYEWLATSIICLWHLYAEYPKQKEASAIGKPLSVCSLSNTHGESLFDAVRLGLIVCFSKTVSCKI